MDRSPILFRCDAGPEAGWEFFYQCLTFGAALQRRRRAAHFVGRIAPFPLIAQAARGGNEYVTTGHAPGSADDCDEVIRAARRLGAAAVVLGFGDVSEPYLRELAASGVMPVVLAPGRGGVYRNRLVVGPLLGVAKKHVTPGEGTQLLLGRRYAVVRPVFRRQRPMRAAEPQGPPRGIVALGEDDLTGQTLLRTRELLEDGKVEKLTVLARSHHPQLAEIRGLVEEFPGKVEVLTEPSEVGTRLPRAHFALTGGDSIALEMACVGVPQLCLTQHPRHALNAEKLDDEGGGTNLGPAESVTASALLEAVHYLVDDQLERVGMSRCAKRLVDGRGPDRLVCALEVMLRADRAPAAPALRLVA